MYLILIYQFYGPSAIAFKSRLNAGTQVHRALEIISLTGDDDRVVSPLGNMANHKTCVELSIAL